MTGDAFDEYAKAKGWTQPENITKLIGPGKIVDLDPATAEILDVALELERLESFLAREASAGSSV